MLKDHRRFRESVETFIQAAILTPELATYPFTTLRVMAEWKRHLQARLPPTFPKLDLRLRPDRRRWPAIPREVEREYAALESLEDVLDDPEADRLCWQPLREGRSPLAAVPPTVTVDYTRVVYP